MYTTITGESALPADISADGLRESVVVVGEMLGIRGHVAIDVRPWASKTMAMVPSSWCIVVYPRTITRELRRGDPRWDACRLWGWVMAHEVVHVSQFRRGAELPMCMREAEAEALEPVYGPIAEGILREW